MMDGESRNCRPLVWGNARPERHFTEAAEKLTCA